MLLEGVNTAITTGDCTGHAEINLVREASQRFSFDMLSRCTLYASTEPCVMCAGAIFWSGIGRVVFGVSGTRLREWLAPGPDRPELPISGRDVLARAHPPVEVIGPALEPEALAVHVEFATAAGRPSSSPGC